MTGTNPGLGVPQSQAADGRRNLLLRVLSALVLAPIAIGSAWFGGPIFALFWAVAAVAILWEWTTVVAGAAARLSFYAGTSAIVLSLVILVRGRPGVAMLIVLLGALAAVVFAPAERRAWIAGGVLYAGVMLIAPVTVRTDESLGFIAILLLFAVVWATDVFGYFVGRAIGGPKLAPRISPKKTWSGALGGTIGGIGIALAVVKVAGLPGPWAVAVIALLLSVVSQAGDIFESALKRSFGVKDSSHLIPGHGGVMDRLDGFWAASLCAALIGLLRAGFDASAQGLLAW